MPTSASNSGSGRKISSPRCSPSNRWFWQGDGLPLATQNTTVEFIRTIQGVFHKILCNSRVYSVLARPPIFSPEGLTYSYASTRRLTLSYGVYDGSRRPLAL